MIHAHTFHLKDSINAVVSRLMISGSNLCERKIIVGKFEASHLLHDLYFDEVGIIKGVKFLFL
jgi:hypothetical protein